MKYLLTVVFVSVLLVACGQEDQTHSNDIIDELTPIDVELIVPSTGMTQEAITFTSKVTQGGLPVNDADEVVFEIWMEGEKESSETKPTETKSNNQYTATYTFKQSGVYHVQSHVTARGLHRMPTVQITIGSSTNEAIKDDKQQETNLGHAHQHGEIDIETEKKENELVFSILLNNEPLQGGDVTLELKQDESGVIEWLDLSENDQGLYTFPLSGEYSGPYAVTVHIKKGELHEHVTIDNLIF